MIVKKVKNPSKSASKAMRVNGLADYIASPEKSNADEKCVYQGSRGFLTDGLEAQKAEMLALAQEAVRSRDPINHYVMSWKENEQPSPAQIEEAIGIFLKEMGLEDHQAIYGLHADTANLHLHVMVNRVHPDSLKVVKPNRGFDIEAAHRAIARIEHVQGWERERHGRYQVLDTGEVERGRESVRLGVDRLRQPEQAKRDMEERTGEKSAERIAIEEAAPVLKEATSWAEVHCGLAEKGMRYEKVGSGAVVFVGDVGVKASRTDRAASLSKMEKRFGAFAPAADQAAERTVDNREVGLRSPKPIAEGAEGLAGWSDYIDGRRAHYAAKTVAVEEQEPRHLLERRRLSGAQKSVRRDILVNGSDAGKRSRQGVWKGKGELRQAMQSILAAEQAGERASLKDRHQSERELLRERFAPYPDFEVWLRERGQPELAEQWRYRDRDRETGKSLQQGDNRGVGQGVERVPADQGHEVARIKAAGVERGQNSMSVVAVPRGIRNYVAHIHGREVHYSRRDAVESASSGSGFAVVAFVDKGREIEVHDSHSDDSLLAALELAAQKWGEFSVSGSDDYKARCAALAVEHGFRIVNPELQERIEQGLLAKSKLSREMERDAPGFATTLGASLPGSLGDVYRRHYEDVVGRQERREHAGKGHVDPSRVDAMIAVRMRITGHDQAAVQEALRQCSPGAHGRSVGDGRNWNHYAERTAQYAFSPAGTRRFDQLGQYRTQWEKLEVRETGALNVERSRRDLSREKPEIEQEDQKRQERGGPGLSR
ncbi:TraI/MobA(P) family conjugative relaxase [Caballeronia sordidicola]|uniref:TraI/MobA(P) family conjugative relaxase n=1 Tax=Caballeronia sordidicola TaxID=196367 RepID=UPI0009FA1F1C|nr:TraI/MobA(P) family conjugative relaxase [Caballeronia sordidicola]